MERDVVVGAQDWKTRLDAQVAISGLDPNLNLAPSGIENVLKPRKTYYQVSLNSYYPIDCNPQAQFPLELSTQGRGVCDASAIIKGGASRATMTMTHYYPVPDTRGRWFHIDRLEEIDITLKRLYPQAESVSVLVTAEPVTIDDINHGKASESLTALYISLTKANNNKPPHLVSITHTQGGPNTHIYELVAHYEPQTNEYTLSVPGDTPGVNAFELTGPLDRLATLPQQEFRIGW